MLAIRFALIVGVGNLKKRTMDIGVNGVKLNIAHRYHIGTNPFHKTQNNPTTFELFDVSVNFFHDGLATFNALWKAPTARELFLLEQIRSTTPHRYLLLLVTNWVKWLL